MLVIVVAAFTVVVVMLVIVVAAFTVVVVMLVIVVAALAVVVVMLVVMMSFFFKIFKLGRKCRSLFHSLDDLCTRKLIPGCRNDYRIVIVLSYKSNTFADFCIGDTVGVAENYASRVFYLIIEKFAKVLHVHLAFVSVYDGRSSVKLGAVSICILDRRNNVGELSYA